jgi:ADP-dependent NAD(P)H-hydrate dehydratase / NAD(P)H-hydrate epimerase
VKAVTTAQIRQLDRDAIATGIPSFNLMANAGYAVAKTAAKLLQHDNTRPILLLAGKGNNGGDAIVAAQHLAAAGCPTTLILLCAAADLTGDPLAHFQHLAGVHIIQHPSPNQLPAIAAETKPALIIDGLLGTGLQGDVRAPYSDAIEFINQQTGVKTLAIDIPSGLDGDTGQPHGNAVRADVTITMGLPKIGLLQPDALDYVGRIEVADIGFPAKLVDAIPSEVELLTTADIAPLLPPRPRNAHKGTFGHLLIIAGSEGYTGAPVLTAHAAARTGVGLVTLAVPREIYPVVASTCPPEIMPLPLDRLHPRAGYTAAAIGPGFGQNHEARTFLTDFLMQFQSPTVLDADAINAMATSAALWHKVRAPLVLTPHPGEMGRLINHSAAEVQEQRWETARQFAHERQITLALKGAGTVVTDPTGKIWINLTGNPGMAKGGMGDALTGIVGALLAQGLSPLDATRAGVYVHGVAGDIAAADLGQRAMLATDLIQRLGPAFAGLDSA